MQNSSYRSADLWVSVTNVGAVDFVVRPDGFVAFRGRKPGQGLQAKWLVLTREMGAALLRGERKLAADPNSGVRIVHDTSGLSHPFFRKGLSAPVTDYVRQAAQS